MGLKFQNPSFNPIQNTILEQTNRPWEWDQTNLVLNSIEKVKSAFLLSLIFMFPESNKILISQITPPKFRYFLDQNEQKEDPMKMNSDNFQIQKWISQTVATCAGKPKVPSSSPAASYVQRWALCSNRPAVV